MVKSFYRAGAYASLIAASLYSLGCQTYYVEAGSSKEYRGNVTKEMVESGELEKKTRVDPDVIDFDKEDFGEILGFVGSIAPYFLLGG